MSVSLGKLATAYVQAKVQVLGAGYGHEILWQREVRRDELTESVLLRECAWVILSSGMSETVVRRKFPDVTAAFLHWSSAQEIVDQQNDCVRSAFSVFQHEGKIRAIAQCAAIVHEKGFGSLRDELATDPITVLQHFPYIGPTTSFHVAKNIGIAVAKPDRHLCRLAELSGYSSAADLCQALAEYIGDPVPVVDIVLWRFATLRRDYMTSFLQTNAES